MPTTTHSRTLNVAPAELWELISDPHHLPRWWPRVARVEDVDGDAFTEVLRSDRGRFVRADFTLVGRDEQDMRLVWAQQIDGTPFAKVLRTAETELRLRDASAGEGRPATEVTITLRQTLRGVFANLGALMVRRATAVTVREALDGLQRIVG